MKFRTSVMIVTAAAAASWMLPGASNKPVQVAHEFLMGPTATASDARFQPVQLAQVFQGVR